MLSYVLTQLYVTLSNRQLQEELYSVYCLSESTTLPFYVTPPIGLHGTQKKPLFPDTFSPDFVQALFRSLFNNRQQEDTKLRYCQLILEKGLS